MERETSGRGLMRCHNTLSSGKRTCDTLRCIQPTCEFGPLRWACSRAAERECMYIPSMHAHANRQLSRGAPTQSMAVVSLQGTHPVAARLDLNIGLAVHGVHPAAQNRGGAGRGCPSEWYHCVVGLSPPAELSSGTTCPAGALYHELEAYHACWRAGPWQGVDTPRSSRLGLRKWRRAGGHSPA